MVLPQSTTRRRDPAELRANNLSWRAFADFSARPDADPTNAVLVGARRSS